MKNQKGFVEVIGAFLILMFIAGIILSIFFVGFKTSDERVSGIVYNTTNNALISGNTHFSVRASENTYIYHDSNGSTNESTYCLPPGSPYIKLINRAAENKKIKVVVTAKKYFAIRAPWVCVNNVKVTEIK